MTVLPGLTWNGGTVLVTNPSSIARAASFGPSAGRLAVLAAGAVLGSVGVFGVFARRAETTVFGAVVASIFVAVVIVVLPEGARGTRDVIRGNGPVVT